MKANPPIQIAGIQFGNALMNGAYIGSKTLEDAQKLAESAAGAVVIGSISVKPRKPNPGHGYWQHKDKFYALNSYGMPNGGLPYFKENLTKIVEIVHAHHKPLIANLIGFSNQEYVELVQLAEAAGADMVELNFGCPNVWEGAQQERILSYHPALVKKTLSYIAKSKPQIKISVKISPLPPDLLREVTKVIVDSGIVQVITATNSYPNASLSSGTKKGNEEMLAGMTGRSLKPISLGIVKQLHEILPKNIDVIGCGGISSKNDVKDFLAAGAKAVQIATALVDGDLGVFQNLAGAN